MTRPWRWLGVAILSACAPVTDQSNPTSTAPSRAEIPTPTATTPTTSAVPVPGALADLVVAPEGSDAGYERALFQPRAWDDLDGDGCDARAEVLIRESRSAPQIEPGCRVTRGDWLSIYDGYSTPDPDELEIDHVVALAEAWRSGGAAWPQNRRLAMAQDDANLLAVTAATNRSKGDRDPAVWQPPRREAWCAFAQRWTSTKLRWSLTADEAEVRALAVMLGTC